MKKIRKRQGCLENFQGKNKNISIGIIGAVPGCGVTTMSVAIANYLAGITRKKVAVYEYNGKRTFMKMNEYLDNELIVCKDRCTYFPKGSVSLALLYNEDFPIVVVDFGNLYFEEEDNTSAQPAMNAISLENFIKDHNDRIKKVFLFC